MQRIKNFLDLFQRYCPRRVLYALPMSLVLLRIVIAFLLLIDALDGKTGPYFLAGFVLAWLSDVADGLLARKFSVTSSLGAIVDGLADLTLYICVIISVYCIYPSFIHSLSALLIVGVAAQLIHEMAGLIKFRKIVSYHSRLAKILSVIIFFAVIEIFGFGRSCYIANLALILWILSNCEGIAMTMILSNYVNNVTSIRAAFAHNDNVRRAKEPDKLISNNLYQKIIDAHE